MNLHLIYFNLLMVYLPSKIATEICPVKKSDLGC